MKINSCVRIKKRGLIRGAYRIASFILAALIAGNLLSFLTYAEKMVNTVSLPEAPDCKSAILMEAETGTILYEMNADAALPPASVTKIMTLLLVMEAIDDSRINLKDTVTVSAHACSMGGSQIYLKEGERMTVEDLLKSVVIASANDAAVALAEHVFGTEDAFVQQMNIRAKDLGMKNTFFENTNGLDDTVDNHVTSARDIAIMSRALISYPKILEFSSIWMDNIRDGAFGLTNTNRLVRFYKGATGLKTGSTAKAGFCISATAERDGVSLICVVMGAPTRDVRNATAAGLLDWGFANYTVYKRNASVLAPIQILGGTKRTCRISYNDFCAVVEKNKKDEVEIQIDLPQSVVAPIACGDKIGSVSYTVGGLKMGETDIYSLENIEKIDFWGVFKVILRAISIV